MRCHCSPWPQVKAGVQAVVAKVITWSMQIALDGVAPSVGFKGEPLLGNRAHLSGSRLAGNYKFAYFGFKGDLKARKESHFLERSYLHTKICETCLAERPSKRGQPLMEFKNFYPDAAFWMTELSHTDFLRTCIKLTPWLDMPGFHIKSVFRDPMHVIFLGTARDFLASSLGYWHKAGLLDGPDLQEQLRIFSRKLRDVCTKEGLHGPFRTYTPSNTGLEKGSEFCELGSGFKAMAVKTAIWYFTKFASELDTTGNEEP